MSTISQPSLPGLRLAGPRALMRHLPNLLVLVLLGGVFYLGHHTGWKLPRSAESASSATPGDWCAEHLVPESICVECKDDAAAKGKEFGFCRTHGVAECVLCHPELAQVTGTPTQPRADIAAALALLPRAENNSKNPLHHRRIQFASAESAEKSGVDVDVVRERAMADVITANGELVFDPTQVAHLSSRAGGTVAHVAKSLGEPVRPGDVLALVDAASVGQAKSQLLQALVQRRLRRTTLDRLRSVGESGGVAGKMILDAESAFQESEIAFLSARQTLVNLGLEVPEELEGENAKQIAHDLQFLGIPAEVLAKLPAAAKTSNLIPVRAPSEGTIVTTEVVAGEVVDTTKPLFTVANPNRMWLVLSVRQEDAPHVSPGLPVKFQPDDGSHGLNGEIAWVSPAIDPRTRTLQVRVTLKNTDGTLRDKTFGSGQIVLREEPHAIVVPRQAVQTTADASFVFVRDRNYLAKDAPKVFHVRQVRLGARDGDYVELLAGVLPGEVVATAGSPVLLAQLLRSSLGAGCGCHDHK